MPFSGVCFFIIGCELSQAPVPERPVLLPPVIGRGPAAAQPHPVALAGEQAGRAHGSTAGHAAIDARYAKQALRGPGPPLGRRLPPSASVLGAFSPFLRFIKNLSTVVISVTDWLCEVGLVITCGAVKTLIGHRPVNLLLHPASH